MPKRYHMLQLCGIGVTLAGAFKVLGALLTSRCTSVRECGCLLLRTSASATQLLERSLELGFVVELYLVRSLYSKVHQRVVANPIGVRYLHVSRACRGLSHRLHEVSSSTGSEDSVIFGDLYDKVLSSVVA